MDTHGDDTRAELANSSPIICYSFNIFSLSVASGPPVATVDPPSSATADSYEQNRELRRRVDTKKADRRTRVRFWSFPILSGHQPPPSPVLPPQKRLCFLLLRRSIPQSYCIRRPPHSRSVSALLQGIVNAVCMKQRPRILVTTDVKIVPCRGCVNGSNSAAVLL